MEIITYLSAAYHIEEHALFGVDGLLDGELAVFVIEDDEFEIPLSDVQGDPFSSLP